MNLSRCIPFIRARPWIPLFLTMLNGIGLSACDGTPVAAENDAATSPDAHQVDVGHDGGAMHDAATASNDAAMLDASMPTFDGAISDADVSDAGLAEAGVTAILDSSHQVLFVGNSYTQRHRLPTRYSTMVEENDEMRMPIRIEAVTPGGYRLSQHADDARRDGSILNRWLISGSASERQFDVVVLQDQSQIPGFPSTEPVREASEDGAVNLSRMAASNGSHIVLYMTWGRRDGDTNNPGLYPDFERMSARIELGYRAYAAAIADAGVPVTIAPVGVAFRLVFEDMTSRGLDPLEAGSQFHALYAGDGSHPSAVGSYLARCVLFETISGFDSRALLANADTPDDASFYQEIAHQAVEAERLAE